MKPRISSITDKENNNPVSSQVDIQPPEALEDFGQLNKILCDKNHGSEFDRQVNQLIKCHSIPNSEPASTYNKQNNKKLIKRNSLAFREVRMPKVCEHTTQFQTPKTRILENARKFSSYGSTHSDKIHSAGEEPDKQSGEFLDNYNLRFSSPSPSKEPPEESPQKQVYVSDIIGNFGLFQFLVLLFSSIREGSVGYDAVIMSTVLTPETDFYCAENKFGHSMNNSIDGLYNGTNEEAGQCFRLVHGQVAHDSLGAPIPCESWIFPGSPPGSSLIADWSLVCHRHWLAALVESAYFFGLMMGNLTWGYWADKVGRRRAYLVAHSLAMSAGVASLLVSNIELLALTRFFCAFGSISYNIIYSLQVELIGTKYRAFSTTLNHFGWGLGVLCVPLANHLFSDYRVITSIAPLLAVVMFPLAFWLPESPSWLMANGQYSRARYELCRAAEYNGRKVGPALEKQITLMKQKVRINILDQDGRSNKSNDNERKSYALIFTNPTLLKDTIILAFTSFVGHLFYYMLTINFGYMKNLSMDANFIITGVGEWVGVVFGALAMKNFSRKTCLAAFLSLTVISFLLQSFIDSGKFPVLDIPIIVAANNGVGTLSSLLLIFIVLIVNQEIYPTIIRQTGSSVVNTIGECGSTLAPLVIQASRVIGLWQSDMIYSVLSLIAIVGLKFLTRTDDIEIS